MSWVDEVYNLIDKVVHIFMVESVHTHLPAQVVSYNPATNQATIKPCIDKIKILDPLNLTTKERPVIDNVPVKQFGTALCALTVPVTAGDYGWLEVSERAMDNWILSALGNPASARIFDISDCIYDPGLYPVPSMAAFTVPIRTDRIEIRDVAGTTYMSVLIAGGIVEIDGLSMIKIGGASATEPAMQATKFMARYNFHQHPTAFGLSGVPSVPYLVSDSSTKVVIG